MESYHFYLDIEGSYLTVNMWHYNIIFQITEDETMYSRGIN